jgi:hypothetical protein
MRRLLICTALVLFAACGARASSDDDDDDQSAIDARVIDGPTNDTELDFSKVYAHSGTVLYRLDTSTLQPVMIGAFGTALGNASMTDIAVDKNDRMLGVSLDNIYEINTTTGAATLITAYDGSENFTSLSFVPMNIQDPNSAERLVAATDAGSILEINQTTGATTPLGTYGSTANGQIRSSGDIVAIYGVGIFATVTIGDTLTDPDYLASINPSTWAATPLGIGTTYDKIFGVGFWKGKLYGFVDTGTGGIIIELNPNTGAVVGSPITGAVRWFGAGVTTDAPIIG